MLRVNITLFSLTTYSLSSMLTLLAVNVSYVPVTCASFAVLVDGYCLLVPGYNTLTYPGPPAWAAPDDGLLV